MSAIDIEQLNALFLIIEKNCIFS